MAMTKDVMLFHVEVHLHVLVDLVAHTRKYAMAVVVLLNRLVAIKEAVDAVIKSVVFLIGKHCMFSDINIKIIFSSLLIILGSACTNQRQDEVGISTVEMPTFESYELNSVVHKLSGNAIFIQSGDIISIGDQYLILTNSQENSLFKVYALPDLTFLYSWGKQGRGPDEFLVAPITNLNQVDERVYVYELGTRELKSYQVTDSTFSNLRTNSISYEGQTNVHTSLTVVTDSLVIAEYGKEHADDDYEYIALEPDNETPKFKFGDYLTDDQQGFERYFSDFKTTAASPNSHRIASFYLYHNRLKIFDDKGELLHNRQVRDSELLNRDIIQGEFQYRIIMDVSESFIFSMGIYKNREEIADSTDNMMTTFEIWDWNGKPLQRVRFDRFINHFTVSDELQKVYGYSDLINDEIYEYDIGDLLEELR